MPHEIAQIEEAKKRLREAIASKTLTLNREIAGRVRAQEVIDRERKDAEGHLLDCRVALKRAERRREAALADVVPDDQSFIDAADKEIEQIVAQIKELESKFAT